MADGTPPGANLHKSAVDLPASGAECLEDTVKVSIFKAAWLRPVPDLPQYAIYSGNSTNTTLNVCVWGGGKNVL